MMNIEVRYSTIVIFLKRLSAAIPHFIIRNFLFDILRFAVPTICSLTQGFTCQKSLPQYPDTRNLTPDT
ncbi:hypothetical protein D1AOALGA4SA_10079 [Olavius algarvensis Delta 1 endosymbiont]|nr:hypothetical protein D1AOALGA4SA_10079 [Olavius algarvensis Delta 1 endosymbiont]